jgi:gluconate 2-dehydrogenase gamma chain
MSEIPGGSEPPRRRFIKGMAGAAAVIPIHALAATAAIGTAAAVVPAGPPAAAVPAAAPAVPDGYQFFSAEEAAFVEAVVGTMCPAAELTPDGVACGLASYMDRQLAGGFGSGERLYMQGPWPAGKPEQGYQLPLAPAGFFRAGLAAAQRACQAANGKQFEQLAPAQRDAFLAALGDGKATDAAVPLAAWFNELVYPLFEQACFADPVYGGNRGKVFWRMVGYPGLPAFHTADVRNFRGKPFPGAQQPQSIQDFS